MLFWIGGVDQYVSRSCEEWDDGNADESVTADEVLRNVGRASDKEADEHSWKGAEEILGLLEKASGGEGNDDRREWIVMT